jgi:hypothetical protein
VTASVQPTWGRIERRGGIFRLDGSAGRSPQHHTGVNAGRGSGDRPPPMKGSEGEKVTMEKERFAIWDRNDITSALTALAIALAPLTDDDVRIFKAFCAFFDVEIDFRQWHVNRQEMKRLESDD